MAKILIADDDLEIQELLKFTLENNGYEVFPTSNGEEALIKILEVKPDLVILDVLMPKMTGYEVCEKIRENPDTCLIPIILLTSLAMPKDRITGIKLGADEYMCKPFEPLELVARVESLLKKLHRELEISPLTGLPGVMKAQIEIKNLIENKNDFGILYIDINDFKSFNEKNGFNKGDDVLKLLAGLLRSVISDVKNSFAIYLQEDDFMVITEVFNAENFAKRIIDSFKNIISKQFEYNLNISIGVGLIRDSKYNHPLQIIDYAKTLCKQVYSISQNDSKYILK